MVLLITGASHTGKTLLAQRLLQTYRCPCLSMDLLKMGLIRSGNTRWSLDFTPSYLRVIHFCCLVMTKAYIETHFADIQKYACAAERRNDGSTCTKETLLLDNAHYQQMCETWGYPCILIDQAYEVDIPL